MNKLLAFPLFIYAILYIFTWLLVPGTPLGYLDPILLGSITLIALGGAILAGVLGNTGVSALTLQTIGESVVFLAFVGGSSILFAGSGVLGILFGSAMVLMYSVGVFQQLDFGGTG